MSVDRTETEVEMSIDMTIHPGNPWEQRPLSSGMKRTRRVGRYLMLLILLVIAVVAFAVIVQTANAPSTADAGTAPIVLSSDCNPFGALSECITDMTRRQPPT